MFFLWVVCSVGHFRVPPGPLYQNEVKCSTFDIEMIFNSHANITHFHKKGCDLSLISKVGVFGTRKWPIDARLRVVPHFSLGIVERAKRERAWKSPHARKAVGCRLFSRGVIFTRARVSLALLSLWGTTCSLYWCILSLMLAYVADAKKEGEGGGEKRDLCPLSLGCLFWMLFHQLYAFVTLFRLCLHYAE